MPNYIPFVRGDSYLASNAWLPLVRGNGFTTQDGGEEVDPDPVVIGPGKLISFNAYKSSPFLSLVCSISPVQSGSGDPAPDNVRPITGHTGVTVYVSPTENVADAEVYSTTIPTPPGTVYGGTLDMVSGSLTNDMIDAEWNAAARNWSLNKSGTYPTFQCTLSGSIHKAPSADEMGVCSIFKVIPSIAGGTFRANDYANCLNYTQSGNLMVQCPSISGNTSLTDEEKVTAFRTLIANEKLILYRVNPGSYQLTPQAISTLVGQNNVWSDAQTVTVQVKYVEEDA